MAGVFARRAPLTDSVAAADRGRRGDGLWQAMARFGAPSRFAADYGLPLAPGRRGLDDAAVREQLRAALRASNLHTWPSREWLLPRAGAELAAAFERPGGPRRWADELGLPLHHWPR